MSSAASPKPPREPSTNAVGLSMPSASGGTSSSNSPDGRERFGAEELAIVMSHYDVGIIETMQEYPRGSRKAPKIILRTDTGMYLLKRRARGKDDAYKVAFCHGVQLYLASKQFPLPHLIGTKKNNNSLLNLKDNIYELFEYIKGSPYDSSLKATSDAGSTLGLFHKLLLDYKPDYQPPTGSYHASRTVARAFEMAPDTLTAKGSTPQIEETLKLVGYLKKCYNEAALKVIELGLPEWPVQIVHSDWHTGNLLFRGSRVVAVIDYDATRIQQRVTDVANGALQFSIIGGSEDPKHWPDHIDESRFKRFLRGYDEKQVLSKAELSAIPLLMIEALIAESIIPIATSGYIGKMEGNSFIPVVARKVHWLLKHAQALSDVLEI